MISRRIALGTLALAMALSACSGYRSGPAIYSRVAVGSPWWGYPYGAPAYVPGEPDVDLPPETLPEPPPEAVPLPAMGMPGGDFGYDDFGYDDF